MAWGQSPENQREGQQVLAFFDKINCGLLTLTSKDWLPILFDNIENMVWGAEDFGCMRVAFQYRFLTTAVCYWALSHKWLISVAKSKKKILWFRAHFLLKMVEKCNYHQHHYGAGIIAINMVLLLLIKLDKMHLLLIDLTMDLKYFVDVELIFWCDEDQVCLK